MKKHYQNGVHDITNNSYHNSEGISRSMLMDFKRSPYHYWYNHISGLKIKDEPTPAMNLGSAVHTLVLEPNTFDDEFYLIGQLTRPRKDTAPWQKILQESDGRIILTPDESNKAIAIANAVKEDDCAIQLLHGCQIEQSIYFNHKKTGIQCKVRPDAWHDALALDLKTSADASYKSFQSSCVNYGYFIQAAMIKQAIESLGLEFLEFVFITVEKEPPYAVAIYPLSEESIQYGEEQLNNIMDGIQYCLENNSWPSYPVQKLSPPGWVKYETQIMEIEG